MRVLNPNKIGHGFLYTARPAVWAGMVNEERCEVGSRSAHRDLLRAPQNLRAIVVNTKFANDLTGRQGRKDTDIPRCGRPSS